MDNSVDSRRRFASMAGLQVSAVKVDSHLHAATMETPIGAVREARKRTQR